MEPRQDFPLVDIASAGRGWFTARASAPVRSIHDQQLESAYLTTSLPCLYLSDSAHLPDRDWAVQWLRSGRQLSIGAPDRPGETFDARGIEELVALAPALSVAGGLPQYSGLVTGLDVLRHARSAVSMELAARGDLPNLGALDQLQEVRLHTPDSVAAVGDCTAIWRMAIMSDDPIRGHSVAAPVQALYFNAPRSNSLGMFADPGALRSLRYFTTGPLDLSTLARAHALEHLRLGATSFSGASVLRELPALEFLWISDLRRIDDAWSLLDVAAGEVRVSSSPVLDDAFRAEVRRRGLNWSFVED